MEAEWDWRNKREKMIKIRVVEKSKKEIKKLDLKKEGKRYELWRIWWTICDTNIKDKIK